MVWPSLRPKETDPPSLVDPDTVLTGPIAYQGFKPVARRNAQVIEHS